MAEPVKLPKEVAEAIEASRRLSSDRFIIYKCIQAERGGEKFDIIPNIDVDTLIRALYIGYEIEQTPEDKLKVIFDNPSDAWNPTAFKAGIIATLNTLNIKIRGVNEL